MNTNKHAPYESFGDTRPAPDELQAIIAGTRNPGPNRLRATFIQSEAYLDLAIADPERRGEWLAKASASQRYLGRLAIERKIKSAKIRRLFQGQLSLVTVNRLRQAEMPKWRQAASAKPLRNNYERLLNASETILPLLKPEKQLPDDPVYTTLLEFMPILLGARRKYNAPHKGWLGRMALYREQGREPIPNPIKNPNWDSGIILNKNATSFLSPNIRLSVKRQHRGKGSSNTRRIRQNTTSYLNAGVLPISAAKHGFSNPGQIILSCLNEFESVPATISEDVELLSSDQLEIVTESLYRTFKEYLETGLLLDTTTAHTSLDQPKQSTE